MTEQTIKGLPELRAFLRAFPERLQKGAMRSAATAMAKPIRDEARLLANKQSGKMAKSIKSGSPRADKQGNVRISIRLKGENAYLGWFSEYGVRPHFISAGDSAISARLLTRQASRDGVEDQGAGVLKIGNNLISGGVFHPGHAAHPFMRPALHNKADEAVQAFGDRIVSYLQQRTGLTGPEINVGDED